MPKSPSDLPTHRAARPAGAAGVAACALAALVGAAPASAMTGPAKGAAAGPARTATHANLTAGGPLRAGIYGRIQVRGTPPPLVHPKPVVAAPDAVAGGDPLYLYVPPGQVRRWAQHCAKWQACDRPVYFVRMDDSPSRLGEWKKTQRPQPAPSAILHALNRFTQ